METPWFASDEFWIASYPFMFPAATISAADEQVDQILALCGREQGDVLDLACGPGRHSISLARRGFRVTGVDRSSFLLDRARKHAESEGTEVEWIEADMRTFERSEAFDLALSMFTSFGYFDLEEENQRVLENIHSSLRPGGTLVIDVLGKEILARGFQATGSSELPGYGLSIQRRTVINDWSGLENEWILVTDTVQRFQLRHWVYSGAELKELLFKTGFGRVQLFGDLSGKPYGPEARRLIAVAGKGT